MIGNMPNFCLKAADYSGWLYIRTKPYSFDKYKCIELTPDEFRQLAKECEEIARVIEEKIDKYEAARAMNRVKK